MSERVTFDIALAHGGGSIVTRQYTSENGEPPVVGEIIPLDKYRVRVRVTNVTPDHYPPIRAQLL